MMDEARARARLWGKTLYHTTWVTWNHLGLEARKVFPRHSSRTREELTPETWIEEAINGFNDSKGNHSSLIYELYDTGATEANYDIDHLTNTLLMTALRTAERTLSICLEEIRARSSPQETPCPCTSKDLLTRLLTTSTLPATMDAIAKCSRSACCHSSGSLTINHTYGEDNNDSDDGYSRIRVGPPGTQLEQQQGRHHPGLVVPWAPHRPDARLQPRPT